MKFFKKFKKNLMPILLLLAIFALLLFLVYNYINNSGKKENFEGNILPTGNFLFVGNPNVHFILTSADTIDVSENDRENIYYVKENNRYASGTESDSEPSKFMITYLEDGLKLTLLNDKNMPFEESGKYTQAYELTNTVSLGEEIKAVNDMTEDEIKDITRFQIGEKIFEKHNQTASSPEVSPASASVSPESM